MKCYLLSQLSHQTITLILLVNGWNVRGLSFLNKVIQSSNLLCVLVDLGDLLRNLVIKFRLCRSYGVVGRLDGIHQVLPPLHEHEAIIETRWIYCDGIEGGKKFIERRPDSRLRSR